MKQQSSVIEIFCCYAREDRGLLDELKRHLSPLQRQHVIALWHDGNISAGTEWEPEIKKHLNDAKIILLLISADFIHSDYCYSTEMQHALERHKQGDAKVIPVLLRPVGGWEIVPPGDIQLGQLQALPKDAKPVTTWKNRDEAWKDMTGEVGKVANELLKKSSISQPGIHNQLAEEVAQKRAHTPAKPKFPVKKVEENFAFKFIVVISVIIALLASILTNISAIESSIRTTLFPVASVASIIPKQEALDKVEKLAPGVDISLYEDKFGKPTFINHESSFINPNEKMGKFVEYVFVDKYFYLDAVTNSEGKVLYFALTIRDKSFNPIFKNQVFQIRLGISKYSDIPGGPDFAQGCYGANWFAYYETRYFGRLGDYEDFGFGFNTAGYYPESNKMVLRGLTNSCQGRPLSNQEIKSMKDLNADETFNTYAVSDPAIKISDYADTILGVNYDQVRILNS
ncbi:MAG TPA: toll/interleukin-1 receptor domain-containing protein [Ktedonobacteraceae bacterium]|nr:toll/interleukin-1 receptor domain-containing protein [Ktedonobacteraceae bacterium]